MAELVPNQGLDLIAERASGVAGAGSAITCLSVDDSTVAFAAGDTALNTGGAVTNMYDVDFDSTPTRSSRTVTHTATIAAGQGNFTIRRIALHNAAAASVSTSSTTLVAGVDGQAIGKTGSFALIIDFELTYSSV